MLSIIIPTLNEEKYLPSLLSCLSSQTFRNFEVIVVDGNSDDKTKEVIKKFSKALSIKTINSHLRNVSFQRNLGLSKARYERILFLDADTSFGDDFLEKALEEIRERDINVCGCLLYPDSKKLIDRLFFFLFRTYVFLFHGFLGGNGCCIFTLKSLHKKVKGFDESIIVSEDFDYTRRLRKFTKINLLNSVVVYTSVRRFEKYGRFRTGFKILLIGLYVLFIGKIRTDIFKYKFGFRKAEIKK